MARLASSEIVKTLGLESRHMNITRLPGRSFYQVLFRLRVPGTTVYKQVNRSCGTDNLAEAKARAALIFAEEIARTRQSKSSDFPIPSPSPAPVSSPSAGLSKVPPAKPTSQNPTVGEIIGHYREWIASAVPGEERPRPETAKMYTNRLLQLARLLRVGTVAELRAAMKGLTAQKIGTSQENFVPLIRSAAGPFRRKAMDYYASQGIVFETPFPAVPAVIKKPPFEAPSEEQIAELFAAAVEELKPHDTQCFLLFALMLGAGLRQQEATHVRWENINQTGIFVRNDAIHSTKTNQPRPVRLHSTFLAMLEGYRRLPTEWVVADRRRPRSGRKPKRRAMCTVRRLAKWIRSKLVTVGMKNPNHWLRKVFGSVVVSDSGMFVASKFLGHASITTTEDIYAGLLGGGPAAHVIKLERAG